MNTGDIAAWQREFFAGPVVWATFDSEGNLSELYESKEAADHELRSHPRHRAVKLHIHSLALSRRRWLGEFAPAGPPAASASVSREGKEKKDLQQAGETPAPPESD